MKKMIQVCDNPDCQGGKHFKECGNGHDICNSCWVEIDNGEKYYCYCPLCEFKARLITRFLGLKDDKIQTKNE